VRDFDVFKVMSEPTKKPNLTRRRFLQWLAGVSLSTGALAGYARVIEPRWLSVDHLEIPIAGLPAALEGKRIAQLSDIHLSDYFTPDRFASAIRAVTRHAPDWLVLTGDVVGNNAEAAAGVVDPLRTLSMPIYAVYGNHDYWSDNATVEHYLRQANVNILLNESAQIESGLWLAGVDDLWSGRPDLKATMERIPAGASTILLAHEPDFFDTVLHEAAPIALQLSGHSHGGQVRLPTTQRDPAGYYSYAPILPMYGRRYPIGLRQINGRLVYTNRGLGVWPIPLRFNCRPELTMITLKSA
jgi:predicted MPP superfamily phosphohydrolase